MQAPSTENYTLGKGKLSFNKYNSVTGKHDGLRRLGNSPSLTSSVEIENLDHYDSQGGLKTKDKIVPLSVVPSFSFTLDEMSAENMELLYMADREDVVQVAADLVTTSLANVNPGTFHFLDKRNIGIHTLAYDGGTVLHVAGTTVTGGTSNTTATIIEVIGDATSGVLLIGNITGSGFTDGEALTDNGSTPGASVVNGVSSFVTTNVSVADATTPTTFYENGVDFTVESASGKVLFPATTGIPEGSTLTVKYGCLAATYTELSGFQQTQIEGMLYFQSDNPVGVQREITAWRGLLTVNGETAYIGDDWSTMSFKYEVLRDEENHPTCPYVKIVLP